MTSSAVAQRKVLRDYKFPDPEGKAQASYYRDARTAITRFHRGDIDLAGLGSYAASLSTAAASAPKPQISARLTNNARALTRYSQRFGNVIYDVLPELRLVLQVGDVQVNVTPDLNVRQGGKQQLIRLDFSDQRPENEVIKIVSQAMFEAAIDHGLLLSTSQVVYLDIARGTAHKLARVGARTRANIQAACMNIQAIWPSI